jgi:hypothetical protein
MEQVLPTHMQLKDSLFNFGTYLVDLGEETCQDLVFPLLLHKKP